MQMPLSRRSRIRKESVVIRSNAVFPARKPTLFMPLCRCIAYASGQQRVSAGCKLGTCSRVLCAVTLHGSQYLEKSPPLPVVPFFVIGASAFKVGVINKRIYTLRFAKQCFILLLNVCTLCSRHMVKNLWQRRFKLLYHKHRLHIQSICKQCAELNHPSTRTISQKFITISPGATRCFS